MLHHGNININVNYVDIGNTIDCDYEHTFSSNRNPFDNEHGLNKQTNGYGYHNIC